MFVFGLCSISDDWPSDLSNEHQPKCEKKAPKSSTNEMVVGLAGVSCWLLVGHLHIALG